MELRSVNNRHFAEVFGLDTKSLNLMEEVFVKQMMFDFFLSPEEFGSYATLLQPTNADRLRALPTHRALAATGETVARGSLNTQETQRKLGTAVVNAGNSYAVNRAEADRRADIRGEYVVDTKEPAGNAVSNCAQVASCTGGVGRNEHNNRLEASPRKLAVVVGGGGHGLNYISVNNTSNTARTAGDSNGDASKVMAVGVNQSERKHKLVV
ncbi:hypothetical protein TRSC58_03605 [Trypanosoma rangeli SC58]|uniref:Uncharacterized protein n=1 Tax=Trypanosoma rangeli SC58 TaxID=429131 RepID=A0A061J177_TRYRA|nr:hypothetical protein TRSC58_03605 [Trypanosoma rangeli SC58]